VGDRTTWKLLDFGVSKLRESSATLTQGAAVGTPSYMSPEQVRGEFVDHRTDIFALGAIAYRALTGRPAFTGPDSLSTMYHVHYAQPLRPSSLVDLHPDVDLVFALALAKDRKQRFAAAPEFADALAEAANGALSDLLRRKARTLVLHKPWRTQSEETTGEDAPAASSHG
jgi:serine/threonine-protein kinase